MIKKKGRKGYILDAATAMARAGKNGQASSLWGTSQTEKESSKDIPTS